jgi:hypothetical protein
MAEMSQANNIVHVIQRLFLLIAAATVTDDKRPRCASHCATTCGYSTLHRTCRRLRSADAWRPNIYRTTSDTCRPRPVNLGAYDRVMISSRLFDVCHSRFGRRVRRQMRRPLGSVVESANRAKICSRTLLATSEWKRARDRNLAKRSDCRFFNFCGPLQTLDDTTRRTICARPKALVNPVVLPSRSKRRFSNKSSVPLLIQLLSQMGRKSLE